MLRLMENKLQSIIDIEKTNFNNTNDFKKDLISEDLISVFLLKLAMLEEKSSDADFDFDTEGASGIERGVSGGIKYHLLLVLLLQMMDEEELYRLFVEENMDLIEIFNKKFNVEERTSMLNKIIMFYDPVGRAMLEADTGRVR